MVRLVIEKPGRRAETLSFDAAAELTIGRSSDCACCLDFDPMVSRMHAVILVDPPSVRIKDLNSTNGLVINGEVYGASGSRRLIQPLELRDGDEVLVGQTKFTVSVEDAGLEFGEEFLRIKSEQDAEAAKSAADTVQDITMDRRRVGGRAAVMDAGGRPFGFGGGGVNETIADPASAFPEIPGYRVERFVAAGKTGNVYKARALETGKAVILKVSTPGERGAQFTRKLVDDFRRETEGLRGLSHRGIAELLASGDMGHSLFYTVSEFVNGENLASYLGRCPGGRIPLKTSFALLRQMVDAVAYLHGLGIVHRDIHPGGLMLFDDRGALRVKLTEAGMARFWAENAVGGRAFLSEDAGWLGFIAPEEVPQLPEGKPSADVFSLGSVFYRMLTGSPPYAFGGGANPREVVEEGRIRPIEELAPGLPETVVVIAERALAADPELRYESALELRDALEIISV